jgi:Spy/CpxP family protein refolding chaperone
VSPVFGAGRLRLLGLGLLVVTFVAGALAGAAVDRVVNADQAERPGGRDHRDGSRRSYVIDQVDMSADQRQEIDAILKRRAVRMRSVWHELSPRLDAITDSARLEIMQVLTPEQRAEYERRLSERETARAARRAKERRDSVPAGAEPPG